MGLMFWIVMLIWLLFGAYVNRGGIGIGLGSSLLPFLAVVLLGWATFGPPIK